MVQQFAVFKFAVDESMEFALHSHGVLGMWKV